MFNTPYHPSIPLLYPSFRHILIALVQQPFLSLPFLVYCHLPIHIFSFFLYSFRSFVSLFVCLLLFGALVRFFIRLFMYLFSFLFFLFSFYLYYIWSFFLHFLYFLLSFSVSYFSFSLFPLRPFRFWLTFGGCSSATSPPQ